MEEKLLTSTVKAMMAPGKGLIAMDESLSTCHKRFARLGIPLTEEARRQYRELIITTPNLGRWISGAILFDETLSQKSAEGNSFVSLLEKQGIVPGIKVDAGTVDLPAFPGEKMTEGLDGLGQRLADYFQRGARFAKWRAVITIAPGLPTDTCIAANAQVLARYAAICQSQNIVPIVEPEVVMDGDHSLERCQQVTEQMQRALFAELAVHRVLLEAAILKPNMIQAGNSSVSQGTVEEVAAATLQCLRRTVPPAMGGVAFLSGGQESLFATAALNAMHLPAAGPLPWPLTFSFSRALHQPAMDAWGGHDQNVALAQQVLAHRAWCNSEASQGTYRPDMERQTPPV
ncbi:class I fructose-bisphosphate aldolase [Planctomicrobium sp. SH664]|uniref:class I fructose-bisphosphate aldolase n=1 Tax=Planctomicrobium sp. SH664 TaxID=3448125 RepID=UPI003F5BF145